MVAFEHTPDGHIDLSTSVWAREIWFWLGSGWHERNDTPERLRTRVLSIGLGSEGVLLNMIAKIDNEGGHELLGSESSLAEKDWKSTGLHSNMAVFFGDTVICNRIKQKQ